MRIIKCKYVVISENEITLHHEKPQISIIQKLIENAELKVYGSVVQVKGDMADYAYVPRPIYTKNNYDTAINKFHFSEIKMDRPWFYLFKKRYVVKRGYRQTKQNEYVQISKSHWTLVETPLHRFNYVKEAA